MIRKRLVTGIFGNMLISFMAKISNYKSGIRDSSSVGLSPSFIHFMSSANFYQIHFLEGDLTKMLVILINAGKNQFIYTQMS